MKIERRHFEAAYSYGRKVYHEEMNVGDAIKELEKLGLNRASASFYIYNLRQMLNGAIYQRAMSAESTGSFLAWIQRDYPESKLRNAVASLRKHIPFYRASNPSPMRSHLLLLEKYSSLVGPEPVEESAVDDLLSKPEGNAMPDRAKRICHVVVRDREVRAYVIHRAKGRCEYCDCLGFKLDNGQRYVEAHHIISLANSGRDTVDNVIALCANHHREAHFGIDAEKLEEEFAQRLISINKPIQNRFLVSSACEAPPLDVYESPANLPP